MDCGGTTSTSELEGSDAATSVSANLSHTRLACCNVDGTLTTYAKEGAGWRRLADCKGDGFPVKAVWAHPEHGAVLAVLTEAGAVSLYSECHMHGETSMQLVASMPAHHVAALAFGPKELGLQVATAGRDGMVRVYQAAQNSCSGEWIAQTDFQGSASSPCTAACWRSYSQALPPMLLLGTGEGAKVFYYNGRLMSWELTGSLGDDAVDDVAWTTTANGQIEYVASTKGSTVDLWQLEGRPDNLQAAKVATLEHGSAVCQVEWNSMGTWLAVATASGDVSLWRPNLAGEWSCQSKIESQDHDADFVMVESR